MRSAFIFSVVAMAAAVCGCSSVCGSGEAKSGDRCVPVRDTKTDARVEGDESSSEASEGGTGESGDADGDANSPGDTAGDSSPSLGPEGGVGGPNSGGGASELMKDGGTPSAAADGGIATPQPDGSSAGVGEPCRPNPCGHGTCAAVGQSFTCACESDWSGTRSCDVNSNAALSTVTISAGKLFPAFKSDVYDYGVDLGVAEFGLAFVPTAAHADGVAITVGEVLVPSGATSPVVLMGLNAASKRVLVRVEANDGLTSRVYTFTIRRTLKVQSELPTTGLGVALAGNRMAVGDQALDEVRLYARSGVQWTQFTKFKNDGVAAGQGFGRSVALNSDWLVVGVPNADAAQVISIADGRRFPLGVASSLTGIQFGASVAISGNVVVVSAIGRAASNGVGAEPASAFVFEWTGGTWAQVNRLLPDATDALECLSADVEGSQIVLGCTTNSKPQGAALVFERRSAGWVRVAVLRPPVPSEPNFGSAVGISGGRIAVAAGYLCFAPGSSCQTTANIYVFASGPNGAWGAPVRFGLLVGASSPERTLPYGFGASQLAFSGNRILVSAPFQLGATGISAERTVGTQAEVLGGILVFGEGESGWSLVAQLGPPAAVPNTGTGQRGYLGTVFAADGETVAAWSTTEITGTNGAIYVYGPDCAQIPAAAGLPGC